MRTMDPRFLAALVFLLLLAGGPERVLAAESAPGGAAVLEEADPEGDEEEEGVGGATVIAMNRQHFVRVKVWLQKDAEGREPERERDDRREERPALSGGILWDKSTVLLPDPVLHDGFYARLEVEAGGVTVPARIAGYWTETNGLLLALEKPLDGVTPVVFSEPPARDEMGRLRYTNTSWHEGEWVMNVVGAAQGYSERASGTAFLWGRGGGLLVRPDGHACGVSFSGRLRTEGAPYPWSGEDVRALPVLSHDEKVTKQNLLRARLRKAAPGVHFTFRMEVDETDRRRNGGYGYPRRSSYGRGGRNEQATEAYATGFHLGGKRLLAPIQMPREDIARIQSIEILMPGADGQTAERRPGRFVGALRDYEALLLEVEGDAPGAALSLDDPGEFLLEGLFLKENVDYSLGRRKERLGYDRYLGLFRSFRDAPAVRTRTNEDDGSIAVDLEGRVLALSVASRYPPTPEHRYGRTNSMFRPAPFLKSVLDAPDAIDPTLTPLDVQEQKRLVWLGVEWQKLDPNLSKLFHASRATRGGEIGLLVLYVYPGSPAEKAGLRPNDILLSLEAPGRAEPVDLKVEYARDQNPGFTHFSRMSEGQRAAMAGEMPPPWPDRRNDLTTLLTETGEGKRVTVAYLRDGEEKSFSFETHNGPRDWASARKERSERLGLTVKEITYEVRRLYRLADDAPGVVVAKVEPGGKAGVAGVYPYQLLTHVDGKPLAGLEAFKQYADAWQDAEGEAVELTVEIFGKTRLAKIEL